MEELVVQVCDAVHDSLLASLAQHRQVPLAQLVRLRRLLPLRVAVQDVVLTLRRRAAPDVHAREAAIANVFEVPEHEVVVDERSQRAAVGARALRREVLHAVDVAEVNAPRVGTRALRRPVGYCLHDRCIGCWVSIPSGHVHQDVLLR